MKSLIAAAVVGLSMLSVSGSETSAQNVRLNMGSTFPSGLVQLGSLGKRLETASKAVSGGTLELKFFEPGALVPALELFDAVSNGSVDAGWSVPGYWQGKEPAWRWSRPSRSGLRLANMPPGCSTSAARSRCRRSMPSTTCTR